MDLLGTLKVAGVARFPRSRGDGPVDVSHGRLRIEVSPLTRGWTRLHHRTVLRVGGFPAHAGMDPGRGSWRPTPRRFPRSRGDGPSQSNTLVVFNAVSPLTRGWTRRRRPDPCPAAGFPAHAGMDPRTSCAPVSSTRLPRPRGDGPQADALLADLGLASPPTRGWTSSLKGNEVVARGFPAHAGMDPPRRNESHPGRRLPRPRGDGPHKR